MFDSSVVEEEVKKTIRRSPSGVSAVFVKLNEKWAIKLFKSEEKRDKVMSNHERCLEHCLAPEIGDTIDLPDYVDGEHGGYRFGYVVEIVEVCPNLDRGGRDYIAAHGETKYEEAKKERDKWEEEMREAKFWNIVGEIEEKTGWYFEDSHSYNWGRKDGKFIPIDFD